MADQLLTVSPGSEAFDVLQPIITHQGAQRMNDERVRLGTYKNMTSFDGCHPVLMARAGLYYSGIDDRVQCYSCSTALSNWRVRGLNPVQRHQEMAPHCGHLSRQDTSNIPIVAPDDAAVTRIKDYLRQRCSQLERNPTQIYFDLCHTFSEVGGVSRGEMFGGSEDLASGSGIVGGEDSGTENRPTEASSPAHAVQAHLEEPSSDEGETGLVGQTENLIDVTISDALHDRTQAGASVSPGIDFDLCKTSVHERLKTFERWPMAAQVHPTLLAEAGFVYTGPGDRVQCVLCEGALRNWQAGDVPAEEHARHFPTCPMICNSQPPVPIPMPSNDVFDDMDRNTPPPLPIAAGGDNTISSPVHVSRPELLGIVTDRPKHPQMSVEASRIASYTSWPTGKQQTPQQLAKAGFFYAGFNDSVKCFFCDGGLRNWEREDDPWHEHARWFPRCKYVRQVKGDVFVDQVLAEQSNVPQQTAVYRERRSSQSGSREGGDRSRSRSGSRSGSRSRSEGASSDRRPAVEAREVLARMDTPAVRAVLNMDIPHDLVQRAIEHRLRTTGDDFGSMEALLETVFELSSSLPSSRHNLSPGETGTSTSGSPIRRANPGDVSGVVEAPRSLIEENRQLKEQRTCKICMDEEVCVVFVPCGHLVCCATCAPALSKCPICRSTIRGTVRTYMS